VTTLSIPSIVPDDFDGGRAAPNALIEQSPAQMGFIQQRHGVPALVAAHNVRS
jgi:DNA-binding LacI/PurR family transcriptional regulator